MNILAVDTSTKNASVAIQKENLILSKNVCNEITHSEKLLTLIDEMLTTSKLNLKNIDLLACTNGPGSFTGIRIGLATIKALAHVNSQKIFNIPTLLLFALEEYFEDKNIQKNKKNYICSLMDAKNDRVYYSIYSFELIDSKLNVNLIYNISNEYINPVLDNITKLNINLSYCSDNIIYFKDIIQKYYKKNSINNKYNFYDKNIIPDAKYIIKYANECIDYDTHISTYNNLDAIYARLSQAERMKSNEK